MHHSNQRLDLTVGGSRACLQGLEAVEGGSMFLMRRVPQVAAATPYAARRAATRPIVRSLAFAARPAVRITARQSGLLAATGTAVSVGGGAVALAETKGWPGAPFSMIAFSTGRLSYTPALQDSKSFKRTRLEYSRN